MEDEVLWVLKASLVFNNLLRVLEALSTIGSKADLIPFDVFRDSQFLLDSPDNLHTNNTIYSHSRNHMFVLEYSGVKKT